MIRFFEGIGTSIGIALARTRAEEEAKNLAKFPSENPFPVLRIAEDGTILYSNAAGLVLLGKWERQVGESAPHDWCQLIGDVLHYNRDKIIKVRDGRRIISFVLAPVAKAGYVNIYGRDVTEQKKAEQALQKARNELEKKVQQRTAELSQTVGMLQEEVRERTLTQQALQQSEARLRDAQRIAHVGNWDWDIVNNQLWWSDEIYRIFGLRSQEFGATYEAFLSYVHPDDREFVKQSVDGALYKHKPYSMDHRIVRPDGTERIVHEQAEIIRDANKSPIRMRGTVQDVTEQKQAEEKILDDQKQLRSLTAELLLSEERERRKIATNLHDSVGQILAFSDRELGTLQKSAPQKLTKSVEEIRHHIKQAVRQTRTLTFDLSPPALYDLGFEAAVEELVEQFSKERKIECHFDSCDQHKPIADHIKILLYRSIRELLTNVAKHSTAKLVRITSSKVNNDILITVEDDGTGFDMSKLESKAGNSKGFGLFSIRERLTHIGGQFDIRSGDGKGTKITLLVPLKPKKLKKGRIKL
jgi:PAS domain S-box-containing protein